jgi:hypothetical protein
MDSDPPGVSGRVAQATLLACVALASWPYGCAQDKWRFGLAAVLLLGSALWWWTSDATHRRDVGALALTSLGLPLLAALQLALGTSVDPVATTEAAIELAAFLAALVTCASLAQERRMALRLAAVFLASASAQAMFGVVQSFVAPQTIYGVAPAIAQTPFGSYVNHNHFAGLMEMAVPLAIGWSLGLLRRAGGPTPAAIALGGLGLGLAAAELGSRSRGGLAALAAAMTSLGLLWWIRHHRCEERRLDWVVACVASAAVIGFAWLASPDETRQHLLTVARGPVDGSGSYRLDIAAATLRLAASRPVVGSGLGAYADAVPAFKVGHGDVRTTHAENDVLQLVAEAGMLGVIVCGALGWVLVRQVTTRQAERGDPVRRGLTLGAFAGAVGLAVHSLLDFNLHIPANALAFVALLGLCAAPMRSASDEPQHAREARRWTTRLCALGLLVLSLAAAWSAWGAVCLEQASRVAWPQARIARLGRVLHYRPYLADAYRERARARMALAASGSFVSERLDRAELDLRAALRLRPFWGEAWADLGWVFWFKGASPEARRAFDQALALDPTHDGIRQLAAQFQIAEKRANSTGGARNLK